MWTYNTENGDYKLEIEPSEANPLNPGELSLENKFGEVRLKFTYSAGIYVVTEYILSKPKAEKIKTNVSRRPVGGNCFDFTDLKIDLSHLKHHKDKYHSKSGLDKREADLAVVVIGLLPKAEAVNRNSMHF